MEGQRKSSWTGFHEFFSQRSMIQENRQQSASGGQLSTQRAFWRILNFEEGVSHKYFERIFN